jgi:hypothetical protein
VSAVSDGQVWVAAVVCVCARALVSVLAGAQCIVAVVEDGTTLRGHCAVSGLARVRCGQVGASACGGPVHSHSAEHVTL